MLAVPLATCCERPSRKCSGSSTFGPTEIFWGEADGRHCQPRGAWRILVHDLSPFDPNASFKGLGRSTDRVCPPKCAFVLGVNLNRPESSGAGEDRRTRATSPWGSRFWRGGTACLPTLL